LEIHKVISQLTAIGAHVCSCVGRDFQGGIIAGRSYPYTPEAEVVGNGKSVEQQLGSFTGFPAFTLYTDDSKMPFKLLWTSI